MKNPLFRRPYWKKTNRGGSWDVNAGNARVSHPDWDQALYRYDYLGFRVFRSNEKSLELLNQERQQRLKERAARRRRRRERLGI